MDVHPLAVTIARINYLLGILPHMKGARKSGKFGLVLLPVYMADALQTPDDRELKGTLIIQVDQRPDERFIIPESAAQSPGGFSELIEQMETFARYPTEELNAGLANEFLEVIYQHFPAARTGGGDELARSYWQNNLRLLNKLIHEKRNSIWAYLLKNTARPLLLAVQGFDVVVGNPPWLSYRYIRDRGYQAEVKQLIQQYRLLDSGDVKLFTQMELATLFLVHCQQQYLKPGGTLAMVMPRSTITGAKQHRPFQAHGISRVLDLLGVFPLFNVPSCVLVWREDDLKTDSIPTISYHARLPSHEITLAEAAPFMTRQPTLTRFVGEVQVASPYHEQIKAGASLYPRNLCFVKPLREIQPGDAATNPAMQTDPDVDKEAKAPWKGLRLRGPVYPPNLYATLLSKNLIPFGYRRLHLVALPVRRGNKAGERFDHVQLMTEREFAGGGILPSYRDWFLVAEKHWDALKKDTSTLENLIDQYDYQGKLTGQTVSGVYKVLYNSSGVHLAACVMDTTGEPPKVYEYPTQGFVIDVKTHYFDTENIDEAHYLSALLNAPSVDQAIKNYQSRGKGVIGQRDIGRTPFEVCAIPLYDPSNPDHVALARLSQQAHAIIAQTPLSGEVVMARRIARDAVAEQIKAIDNIARRLLNLPG
jgi:hypothetical protein